MEQHQPLELKVKKFERWLSSRGAEVLKPASVWEIARFRSGSKISVIYTNKNGQLSFVGDASEALDNYKYNGPWRARPSTKRKSTKFSVHIKTLLDRDGNKCFFCNKEMSEDDTTREHLIALSHGGPDHISNMVLAHSKCNLDAGTLSLIEKVKIHIKAKEIE